jgi:hypothetical protein
MSKPVTEDELIAKVQHPRVTLEYLLDQIVSASYTLLPNGRTTICQLELKNGFTVEGKSACVHRDNYNEDLGNRIAHENAVNEIWPLLGYELASKINSSEATTGEDGAPKGQPERSEGAATWEDRVRQEAAELSDRMSKLDLFIADDFKFLSLPDRQQRLLKEQRQAMGSYHNILEARMGEYL